MKKQILCTVVCLGGAMQLSAQAPVIDTANYFKVGRSYMYKYKIDLSVRALSEGSSGANVMWDFSSLDMNEYFAIDTTVCMNPTATAKFASCGISGTDTADVSLVNKSTYFSRTDDFRYYALKGGKIIETGSDQDNGVVEEVNFQYQDRRTFSLLPFTYLTASVDSFRGTYFNYLSGPHFLYGTDSLLADGYGTLKVNGQVYTECVRLKKVSYRVDSNDLQGVYTRREAIFTWYSRNKPYPVLIMEKQLDTNSSFPEPAIYAVTCYFEGLPTTNVTTMQDMQYSIYPVPARDHLVIEKPGNYNTDCALYNATGHVVLQKTLNAAANKLDVSMLTPGIYYYKFCSMDGRSQRGTIRKE